MPSLADYVSNLKEQAGKLDKYKDKLDAYIEGKADWPETPDLKTASAVEVLMPLKVHEDALMVWLVEIVPPVEPPMKRKKIDFDAVLMTAKNKIIKEYGKYAVVNPELSVDNPFMVWAFARQEASLTAVSSLEGAVDWYNFLKPLVDTAFMRIIGSDHYACDCQSCTGSDCGEEYKGEPPETIDDCISIRHILRKLKVSYLGGLVIIMDERNVIAGRESLLKLIDSGYDFDKKATGYLKRAWSAGQLARGMV